MSSGSAESAVAVDVLLARLPKIAAVVVRPQLVLEDIFGVRSLPDQKVTRPLLPRRADEQVDVRQPRLVQVPDALAAGYKAFDEGWITDGRGKKVYLSDAIVIMTSNLGSANLKKYESPLSFGQQALGKNHLLLAFEFTRELGHFCADQLAVLGRGHFFFRVRVFVGDQIQECGGVVFPVEGSINRQVAGGHPLFHLHHFVFFDPQVLGQELGRRAGTENVAGIAAFGAAVRAAMAALECDAVRLQDLRNRLERGLRHTPGMIVFSDGVPRLPNTTLFTVPGLKAETAVIGFDLAGIAVSSGSACSSGKVQPSHVLEAMGFGKELARGAVRLSLGWSTTEADIDLALQAWRKLADALLRGRRNTA